MTHWFRSHPKLSISLGVLALLLILLVVLALKPFSLQETFTPDPAQTYEEALARIESMQAEEAQLTNLSPECGSLLMTHDEKVENVVVFLHGFTSCPDQFASLGEEYSTRATTSSSLANPSMVYRNTMAPHSKG